MMGTEDIDTELSSSKIVEDDLNGVFNSLEPLEDPKDDMYFFGGKDESQKIRERNPGNTTEHKPSAYNKPAPPLTNTLQDSTANHQVPISFSNPNDPSCLHSNNASNPSSLYGNYFSSLPVATISPLPLHHSGFARILKEKPANKRAAILKRSKSLTTTKTPSNLQIPYPQVNLTSNSTNIVAPPPPLPTPVLHSSLSNIFPSNLSRSSVSQHPLSFSDPSIHNINNHNPNSNFLGTLSTQDLSTKFGKVAQSPKKKTSPSRTSGEIKHRRTPKAVSNNFIPHNSVPSHTSLNQTMEIYPSNTTTTTTTTTTTHNAESSSQSTSTDLQASSDLFVPKQEPDYNVGSGNPFLNNFSATNNETDNNNDNNTPKDSNSTTDNSSGFSNNNSKKYPFSPLANSIAYYNYINAMQHAYMHPPPVYYDPIAVHDPNISVIDNSIKDSSYSRSNPVANPSNDLYSCLYVNNSNTNNNNIGYASSAYNPYERSTSPANPSYNLYNYNNLYNNFYDYPHYPPNNQRGYNPTATYLNTFGYLDPQSKAAYEKEDYDKKGHRSKHSKSSKSSKRNRDSDSEGDRRKARKSKNRGHSNSSEHSNHTHYSKHSKHSKHKSSSHSSHSRHHYHNDSEDNELPDYDIQQFSSPNRNSDPPSPYLVATKHKKANLFENTPKIKIGESPGTKTRISKLGKKMLQVVGMDWRDAPFTSPSLKGPCTSEGNQDSSRQVKPSVFVEYDCNLEKKTELLFFIATNIDSILKLPTKIEISLKDFKSSNLGAKVRERMDVMNAVKTATDQGLLSEQHFSLKQQQFLDAFKFGMEKTEAKRNHV